MQMLKKYIVVAMLAGVFLPFSVMAQGVDAQGFVVQKITLSGVNASLLPEVQSKIPVKVGQTLTPGESEKIIQALYGTGYFDDISIYRQGNALLVQAHQRPTIASITFTGNKDIKTDQLNQVLMNAGLQTGDLLNMTVLGQIRQSLLDQYYSQGKYAVQVTTHLEYLPRDRVDINIAISEGLATKIERINIVGASAFPQKELINQLMISTPGFIAFFTSTDKYSQEKMLQSMDALTKYYMDRGYINFRINSVQVSLSPDKKQIYVTINVTQGAQYHFSGYELSGDLILPTAVINGLVNIQKGQLFSRQNVMDTERGIENRLGDNGYAFASVNPIPKIDDKTKTVFITLQVNPGKRYYVRFINFTGNTSTNDQVLRQQMRYVEDSLYDRSKVEASKERLMRNYSFLAGADEKTNAVPNTSDLVDTNFNVKEQSANQVSASIGYSQLYKVLFGVGLTMPNVFGTGNIFSINTQLSKPYQSVNFNYTEPFFTMSGIQQSIGVYVTRMDNADTDIASYTTNSIGTTLNYTFPLNDTDSFTVGGGLDHTSLENPSDGSSAAVSDFTSTYGNSFNTYTLNAGWSRNSTDRYYFPTKGDKENLSGTLAGPGSTLTWYKLFSSADFFYPLTQRISFGTGVNMDYGKGYGKDKNLPLYQNFYGGGWGSVRGYSEGGMGPRDTITCTDTTICTPGEGEALGGNLSVNASANVYFPMPFAMDNNNVRWGLFVDAGNVYSTYTIPGSWATTPHSPNFANIRYSSGIELEWQIPHIGPLAVSLAKPLNSQANDQTNIFQFSIGGQFNN